MKLLRAALFSLLAGVIFPPQIAQAQSDDFPTSGDDYQGEDSHSVEGRSDEFEQEKENGPKLTDADEVLERLATIRDECQPAELYRIDCLAERLTTLEKSMDNLVGYGEARDILSDTANQLREITQNNLDQDRPRARLESTDGSFRSKSPLSAVSAANERRALAQAVAVLAEAETRLLRSAESSSRRAVQYQQIAAALGSNKVLLRS
ncbi:hypothetical protein DL239_16695 [Sedimentitalea sp. CY04]|uniref:Secreted protein n=1 Tax=Parasedimentitalea denitrificans TaxID=2211118 RepID=A0ABX0WAQ2_9RHOB|nr:hypothetical protein [Sedimentitalea sp. CY04]NIZ62612.1 hypothetical protein [Sedimentitalea sp. CY04]